MKGSQAFYYLKWFLVHFSTSQTQPTVNLRWSLKGFTPTDGKVEIGALKKLKHTGQLLLMKKIFKDLAKLKGTGRNVTLKAVIPKSINLWLFFVSFRFGIKKETAKWRLIKFFNIDRVACSWVRNSSCEYYNILTRAVAFKNTSPLCQLLNDRKCYIPIMMRFEEYFFPGKLLGFDVIIDHEISLHRFFVTAENQLAPGQKRKMLQEPFKFIF